MAVLVLVLVLVASGFVSGFVAGFDIDIGLFFSINTKLASNDLNSLLYENLSEYEDQFIVKINKKII